MSTAYYVFRALVVDVKEGEFGLRSGTHLSLREAVKWIRETADPSRQQAYIQFWSMGTDTMAYLEWDNDQSLERQARDAQLENSWPDAVIGQ